MKAFAGGMSLEDPVKLVRGYFYLGLRYKSHSLFFSATVGLWKARTGLRRCFEPTWWASVLGNARESVHQWCAAILTPKVWLLSPDSGLSNEGSGAFAPVHLRCTDCRDIIKLWSCKMAELDQNRVKNSWEPLINNSDRDVSPIASLLSK